MQRHPHSCHTIRLWEDGRETGSWVGLGVTPKRGTHVPSILSQLRLAHAQHCPWKRLSTTRDLPPPRRVLASIRMTPSVRGRSQIKRLGTGQTRRRVPHPRQRARVGQGYSVGASRFYLLLYGNGHPVSAQPSRRGSEVRAGGTLRRGWRGLCGEIWCNVERTSDVRREGCSRLGIYRVHCQVEFAGVLNVGLGGTGAGGQGGCWRSGTWQPRTEIRAHPSRPGPRDRVNCPGCEWSTVNGTDTPCYSTRRRASLISTSSNPALDSPQTGHAFIHPSLRYRPTYRAPRELEILVPFTRHPPECGILVTCRQLFGVGPRRASVRGVVCVCGWLLASAVTQSVGWRERILPRKKGRGRCQGVGGGGGGVPKGVYRVSTPEMIPLRQIPDTPLLPCTLLQRPPSRIAAVLLPQTSHDLPLALTSTFPVTAPPRFGLSQTRPVFHLGRRVGVCS